MMTEKRGIARRQAELSLSHREKGYWREKRNKIKEKNSKKVHRYNESMQEESINEVGRANENISAKFKSVRTLFSLNIDFTVSNFCDDVVFRVCYLYKIKNID